MSWDVSGLHFFKKKVIFPSLTVPFESVIVRFIKDWKKDKLY